MQVYQSEIPTAPGVEWLMRGGSWGFVIVYGREADIMIIDVVGISSSTMAIGGSSIPLS